MFQKQKEEILVLLKANEMNRDYKNRYWFLYKDFLDPRDSFTDFSCENFEGKQEYITLIENLLNADESAKIFVEVYGYEEDNGEQFVYADTLIIYSKLSLAEIKQIFNEPKDIFPDDIGELNDFSRQNFVVGDNGELISALDFFDSGYSVYYCWWD